MLSDIKSPGNINEVEPKSPKALGRERRWAKVSTSLRMTKISKNYYRALKQFWSRTEYFCY